VINSIKTAHPITNPGPSCEAKHFCRADGFSFEDRPHQRMLLLSWRGSYVCRIPYEAIAAIHDDAPPPEPGQAQHHKRK
jgi:hypothetical protein